MFFLVPRIALILFVCFGLAAAWRSLRQRRSRLRGGRAGRRPFSHFPLVPAEVLQGADRTWVVFTTGQDNALAERLRAAEPLSQVSEVDARREPRLAEAFGIDQVPAVLRANRYGQVEARMIGLAAIESALARPTGRSERRRASGGRP
jgi:hypothetical protein